MAKQIARMADRSEDYKRLGMKPGSPEPWEDGLRTEPKKGSYEWWYFDCKLDGGGSMVIVYYTVPLLNMKNVFAPFVSLQLTLPDGTEIVEEVKASLSNCSFAKDRCDVRIGDCFCEGDLKNYTLRYVSDRVKIDVQLSGNVPAWRPSAGQIFFGEKDYFAWLPSVPEGNLTATLTLDGETRTLTGTGYHDHNWGNVAMTSLMHHWYWGRAKIGDYTSINCYITALKKYGYEHFPVYMLAKDGKLLGDDVSKLTYTQADPVFIPGFKKHFHQTLIYDYVDGDTRYKITYKMKELVELRNVDNSIEAMGMPRIVGSVMKVLNIDPGYQRVAGDATLEKYEGGQLVESITSPAMWELMYMKKDEDV